jgi:hypothetical protein
LIIPNETQIIGIPNANTLINARIHDFLFAERKSAAMDRGIPGSQKRPINTPTRGAPSEQRPPLQRSMPVRIGIIIKNQEKAEKKRVPRISA